MENRSFSGVRIFASSVFGFVVRIRCFSYTFKHNYGLMVPGKKGDCSSPGVTRIHILRDIGGSYRSITLFSFWTLPQGGSFSKNDAKSDVAYKVDLG